jgi:glycosyltransferase involved in cell wall biosynthesis
MSPRLFFFDRYLSANVGGAQRSALELLSQLPWDVQTVGGSRTASFNADQLITSPDPLNVVSLIEVPRFPYFEYELNRESVMRYFSQFSPHDILFTQELYGIPAALGFPGKIVYFARSEFSANIYTNYHRGVKRIFSRLYRSLQSRSLELIRADTLQALNKAAIVVANSHFLSGLLQESLGVVSKVCYPTIDITAFSNARAAQGDKRRYITLIGEGVLKGRDLFYEIARRRSDLEFLIVGRSFSKNRTIGNVTEMPWSNDPLQVLAQTKILLVPSRCSEGFGRIAVEASACGIPTLSSARGGLCESTPEYGLVDPPDDISIWLIKLEYIMNNYATSAKASMRFAEEHLVKQQRHLTSLLEDVSQMIDSDRDCIRVAHSVSR